MVVLRCFSLKFTFNMYGSYSKFFAIKGNNFLSSCWFSWATNPSRKEMYSLRKQFTRVGVGSYVSQLTPIDKGGGGGGGKNKTSEITSLKSVSIQLKEAAGSKPKISAF